MATKAAKIKEKTSFLEKVAIYGGNFAVRPIGNAFKESLNLGNAYGAILYASVDLMDTANLPITNAINNTVKLVGGGVYFLSTIKNLVGLANGNVDELVALPFNASMLYTSIKDVNFDILDTIKTYKKVFKIK